MTPVESQPVVGALLRQWRERRRVTQLELALDAGISARHLSFVETGRSRPGREMRRRPRAGNGHGPNSQPRVAPREAFTPAFSMTTMAQALRSGRGHRLEIMDEARVAAVNELRRWRMAHRTLS